jgi:hypothetical protein
MGWTKEHIHRLLDDPEKGDKATIRAAFAIYHRQTPDEKAIRDTKEKNGVGFSAYDAEPMSRFCNAVAKGWRISPKWMNYARRTMKHYHRQLIEIAEAERPGGPRPLEAQIEPATLPAAAPCTCELGDGEPDATCTPARCAAKHVGDWGR